MTIEELVLCILKNNNKIEEKEQNILENKIENEKEIIYSINQLIDNYSIFTRYNINKAITEKGLPYFHLGSKKYFKKKEIDQWIRNQKDGK